MRRDPEDLVQAERHRSEANRLDDGELRFRAWVGSGLVRDGVLAGGADSSLPGRLRRLRSNGDTMLWHRGRLRLVRNPTYL